MGRSGLCKRVLEIYNRTENWKTARCFAPLFGEAAIGLARRLDKYGYTKPEEVRLELFWHGMRDFLFERIKENDPMNDRAAWKRRIQTCYSNLFPDLKERVRGYPSFRTIKYQHHYSGTEIEELYTNLIHTEIDIVLETPRALFVGEAKYKMNLGSNGKLVLVHQLIRQYVMAKILVDLSEADREVIVFVVGVKDNQCQVRFMIDQGWMKACNVLSWSEIKQLVLQPAD